MDMETLMEGIDLPQEEREQIRSYPLSEEEWQIWRERYEQDRPGFYEALEAALRISGLSFSWRVSQTSTCFLSLWILTSNFLFLLYSAGP